MGQASCLSFMDGQDARPTESSQVSGIISAKCLKWTLFEELSFPAIAQERQERAHLFALQHISSDSECNQPDCNAA